MSTSFQIYKDETTAALTEALSADHDKRSMASKGTVFKPNQITQCPRRIFYRTQGVEQSLDNSFAEECHLAALSKKWAEYFTKCTEVKLIDKDILVAHAQYNISGVINSYIEFQKETYAVIIKPEDLEKRRKAGSTKRKDIVEVVTYLWLSELRNGLLIYEDMKTRDYEIFNIGMNPAIINTVKSKCKDLIMHQLSGLEPPKSGYHGGGGECGSCEYKGKCLNS